MIAAPVGSAPVAAPQADAGALFDALATGETVATPQLPLADGSEGVLPVAPAAPSEGTPHEYMGASRTCPSCGKRLPGARICVECGIDVKTGRALITTDDGTVDQAYSYAEGTIRWLSWLIPVGVYPVASEAFGLRAPWVTRAIAALTIALSVWFIFAVEYDPEPTPDDLSLMLWNGDGQVDVRGILHSRGFSDAEIDEAVAEGELDLDMRMPSHHPYQLITHAFLHGGWLHLASNMLFLLVLGTRVNALIGNILTLLLYPLLAVVAAVAHLATLPADVPQSMLGASGAIMGLAGMYLVLFPIHKVHLVAWWRWGLAFMFKLNMSLFAVRGFWVVLFYIAFDIVFTALRVQDDVAHWAHLGGFFAGAAIALLLLFTRLVNARGGDLMTAVLGRHAWKLIGKPNERRWSLW